MFYCSRWIIFFQYAVFLVFLALPVCLATVRDVILSSTENSVTVTFQPDPVATNYTAMFYMSSSIFFTYIAVEPPYNDSRVSMTYTDAGPSYNYTVEIYENATDREHKVFNGTIATVPFAPINVRVTQRTSSSMFIEWDSQSNLTYSSHNISYQIQNAASVLIAQGTADTFFNLTNLDPGFQYEINVRAISYYPGGASKGNNSLSVTNYTLPSKPINLTAEALNTTHIYVTWEDEPGSHQDSSKIEYYTQESSGNRILVECTDSPCTIVPGSPAGQNVTVIIASQSNGLSSEEATIECSTKPGMVHGPDAVGGVRSLKITWGPPSTSVVLFYTVLITDLIDNRTRNHSVPAKQDDSPLTYLADQLRGGSTYKVSVTAETPFATGRAGIQVFYTVPEPVSDLKAIAISTTSISISWANPDRSEIANIRIDVEMGNTTRIFTEDSSSTSRVVIDLVPGEFYSISVTVLTNFAGLKSEAKNTTANTKPVMPKLVSLLAGETQLAVHVDRKSDEGVYDNFVLVLQKDNKILGNTTANPADFEELIPGTSYELTAYTVSRLEKSDPLLLTLYTRPRPPGNLVVEVVNGSVVHVEWDKPDEGGYDNFTVTIEESKERSPPQEMTTQDTYVDFTAVTAGIMYNVSVVATKGDQSSTEVYGQNITDPESVAALQKVDATSDSISVNWTAPVSGDFNQYQLRYREDAINTRTINVVVPRSGTNYTIENLRPGQVYTIAIRTELVFRNQAPRYGISSWLKALTKPLPVVDLIVHPVNTSTVNVTWSVDQTSQQNSFLISYGTSVTKEVIALNTTQDYEMTIGPLLSGGEYSFEVVAKRSIDDDSEESEPALQSGFTVPLPASTLNISVEATTVKLSWEQPSEGDWDGYEVTYRPVLRSPETPVQKITSPKDKPNVQISDLFPGEKYEVIVRVKSHGLYSEEIAGSTILAPLKPVDIVQDKSKTTTSSVSIGWMYNANDYFVEHWLVTYTDGVGALSIIKNVSEKSVYNVILPNLVPGQEYTVMVKSVVKGVESSSFELTVTAKPVIRTNLEEIWTTNSSVRMDYTVNMQDVFDKFVFSLEELELTNIEKAKTDIDHKVTFTNLQAGTHYTFKAITVSNGEESSPQLEEFVTDPNPVPVNFSPTAREIQFEFSSQPGNIATHTISCAPSNPNIAQCAVESQIFNAGDASEKMFDRLKPFTTYTFEVVTKTQIINGREKNASKTYEVKTGEAAPTIVQELKIRNVQLHSFELSWKPPASIHGIMRNYHISYRGREPNFKDAPVDQDIHTVSASKTSFKLTGLKAGYEYTFGVFARTIADGPQRNGSVRLPTGNPSFRGILTAEISKPIPPKSKAIVTQQKLSLEFVNPFDSDQGYVSYYTVIVSKDPKADDKASTLPSWSDMRKDSSIKVYQTLDKCTNFFTANSDCGLGAAAVSRKRRALSDILDSRVFIVGGQTEAECGGAQFCNGPLDENTKYYIKLRGFTSSGNYSETVYSEPIRTAEESASSAGLIGGLIAAVVIVGIIAFGVVFFLKRRAKPKRATKHTGSTPTWEQASLSKFSRVVKLAHFGDHIKKMSADSDFKYAEEYEDLKEVGRGQPTLASEFPPNRPKNRFTNILPYDHSRVKLLPTDDEEGSDYINANYMPGYSSKREYIATQGPLTATRDDLWRMLWEQGSRNIVMLTKCQEKGREKSDHYWPTDMEPKYYGDLQVVILAETPMPDWTVTEFKVSKGDQSKIVRHFHYRSWPDFGVPQDPSSLIRFVRTVRERLISEGGPIITHCSAGVGRSGTFIILDHLLQLIREKDEVDVFNMVYKLRKERVLMVQTEQQYKFIHECLLCVLENREDDTTYANVGQINIGYEDD